MKPRIRRFITVVFVGAALVGFLGCHTMGQQIDQSKVAEIKKGQTTEADLVQMFGPPNQRTVSSEGNTILMWMYHETRVKGASFIPIVGLFAGGADTKQQSLVVTLGPDGKVTQFQSSGGSSDSRRTPQ